MAQSIQSTICRIRAASRPPSPAIGNAIEVAHAANGAVRRLPARIALAYVDGAVTKPISISDFFRSPC
jgi:hypothetical protein